MNKAQFFLLAIIFYFVFRTAKSFMAKKIFYQDFFLWMIFWGVSAGVVIYPEITQRAAEYLGLGRGVDLAIYLALLIAFYFIFSLRKKNRELEETLTQVGRTVTITSAKDNSNKQVNN
jgi:hypothetical protein